MKKALNPPIFRFLAIIISIVVVGTIGELGIRIFNPASIFYPRYKFSSKYGLELFENCRIVNARPRYYKFIYTTNEFGFRGKAIPIADSYQKENIVILGDSYSFGVGVNDGEEYPAIMDSILYGFNVINLGSLARGLTQEIRVFYEFGQKHKPKIVLLQFFGNDLRENSVYPVTTVENGNFVFHDLNNSPPFWKRFLSIAVVQKSHLYRFLRDRIYSFSERKAINKSRKQYTATKTSPGEEFYNNLLQHFAIDLHNKGINLILISVNGELDKYHSIKEKVLSLKSEGFLDYCEIEPWFEGISDYGSPEGHKWGKKAHKIIGINLAKYINENYSGNTDCTDLL